MALMRRTGHRVTTSIWTGFVDAMTGLLLVLMFVLSMFMIVQFILSGTITTQSDELARRDEQIADLQAQVSDRSSELERLLARINSLIGDIEAGSARISQLETDVSSQARELASAAELSERQRARLAKLGAERDQQAELIANLEQQIADSRGRIAVLLAELVEVSGQKSELEGQVAAAAARNTEQEAAISELGGQLEAARTEHSLQAQLLADFETQVAAFKEQVAALLAELESALELRKKMEGQIAEAGAVNQEQFRRINSLQDLLKTSDEERDRQAISIAGLELQITEFEALVATLRQSLAGETETASALRLRLDATLAELQTSRKSETALKNQIAGVSEENRQQFVLIESQQERIAADDEEKRRQLVLISSLEDRIAAADSEKQQQLVLIESQRERIADADEEKSKQLVLISSLEDRIAGAENEIELHLALISSLRDDVAAADRERQQQLVLIESQRERIADADEEKNKQLVLISSLRDEIAAAGQEKQQQLILIESQQGQIAAAEEEKRKQLVLISSLQDRIAGAENEIEQHLALISSLRDDVAAADKEKQQQLVLIESQQERIAAADEEKSKQLVLISSLEDRIAGAENEIEQHLALISSLRDEVAAADSEKQQQLVLIESQRELIAVADEEKRKQLVLISSLEDRIAGAENEIEQHLALISSLRDEVAAADEEYQQQIIAMNSLREALDAEGSGRKAAEEQLLIIPELRQQVSDLDAIIIDLRAKLEAAESEVAAANNSLAGSGARITELEEALRSIASERNLLLAQVAELRSRLAENQEQVAALTTKRDAQKSSIEQQARDLAALEARIEQLVLELKAAAEDAKREAQRAVAAEKQRLKGLEDIQDLQIALGAASEESDKRQLVIDDYQLEVYSLEERIAALIDAKGSADLEIEDLRTQLADLRNEHDAVQVSASESRAGMIALTLELDEKRREAEETLRLLVVAESAKTRLEALLGERNADVSGLSGQLEDLRQRLSASESAREAQNDAAKELRGELEQARVRVARLETSSAVDAAELDRLRGDLQSARLARDTAQASLRALQAKDETGELQKLLDELVRQRQQEQSKAEAADDRAEKFKQQAESIASDLAAAEFELDSAKKRNTELADQLEVTLKQSEETERILQAKLAELATIERLLNQSNEDSIGDKEQITLLNLQIAELRDNLGQLNASLEQSQQKEAESQVVIDSLGSDLNAALARVAAEERRSRELEEAARKRAEQENLQLERYRSEFFGRLRDLLEGREGIEVAGDRFLFSSEVLFDLGEADLSAEGKREIGEVARLILDLADGFPEDVDWVLRVDGHTDDLSVLPASDFSDNWELSQSRSLSVVRHLIEALEFPPERLAATGFGEFRPLVPNQSEEARSKNRRIEFKLTEP